MRNRKIFGLMMRPSSKSEEDNKEIIMGSASSTTEEFLNKYNNHIAEMEVIAESAKIYIIENWKNIKDWSNIEISIKAGNTGKITEYYKYKESIGWTEHAKFIKKRIDKTNKKRHNPMGQITEIVLDPTDGDFSVNIGEIEHWWIDDESIIILANYIEEILAVKAVGKTIRDSD